MKRNEIIKYFKNEWVLINIKEFDEVFNLKEGYVIVHSKRRVCNRSLKK